MVKDYVLTFKVSITADGEAHAEKVARAINDSIDSNNFPEVDFVETNDVLEAK